MRGLPRRLQHSEEATFVEHLEELRWRIIVMLCALAVATIVAFAFHGHILDWLNQELPADRRRPVTLGVAEPFTVSLTVSLYAGFLLALPVLLWALFEGSIWLAVLVERRRQDPLLVDRFRPVAQPPD